MTRSDLSAWAVWIRLFDRLNAPVVRASVFERDAEALELAERLNVIRRRGRRTETNCDRCDIGFRGKVTFDEKLGWGHTCLCGGRVPLIQDQVDLVTLDQEELVKVLAAALGRRLRQVDWRADGHLVSLGELDLAPTTKGRPLTYARRVDQPTVLSGVIDALKDEMPRAPGLVVTAASVARATPLPHGYRFVGIDDVFVGEADQIIVDRAALKARLELRFSNPGRAGRPSPQIPIERKLYRRLCGRPEWPATLAGKARMMRDEWPDDAGVEPNAVGTIAGHIRRYGDEWSRP